MFDKDRFHNALALSLGYERIIKDKRFSIEVENSDDPLVTLIFQGCLDKLCFKASDIVLHSEIKNMPVGQDDIQYIFDMIHQAYQEACNSRF